MVVKNNCLFFIIYLLIFLYCLIFLLNLGNKKLINSICINVKKKCI